MVVTVHRRPSRALKQLGISLGDYPQHLLISQPAWGLLCLLQETNSLVSPIGSSVPMYKVAALQPAARGKR
jgi:hypothetical protein